MAGMRGSEAEEPSLLGRMLTNAAWLLGGKGFGAVCSLIYLGILTRSLGLDGFGHFALIFGTSQALIAIAGFQSWIVVVRYAARHVHEGNWAAFGRLAMLGGVLDVIGAALGCVIAWIVFYHFAGALDLDPALVDLAFWFNVASLWALVSAPTGIVRALDRFDTAIYIEAIVPAGRLIAAGAIALLGPSLASFLVAWAVIDLLEAALYWIVSRRLCPQAVQLAHLRGLRRALAENAGIVRFFLITHLTYTIDAIYRQGPLLLVGWLIGTSAAGIYRLADQLAQGLTKLSSLLSRAAYAEVNRARVVSAPAEFRKLIRQTSAIAAGGGAVIVGLVLVFGGRLLELVGGDAFGAGAAVLLALTVAASFDLASVAFEPVLHATDRARLSLLGRLLALVIAGSTAALLAGSAGPQGVAWSVAAGALAAYLAMGLMARVALGRLAPS